MRPRSAEGGFTIIEVALAAVIATLGIVAISRIGDTILRQTDPTSTDTSVAEYGLRQEYVVEKLLQDVIEAVKAADAPTIEALIPDATAVGTTIAVPVNGFAPLPILDPQGITRSYEPELFVVSFAEQPYTYHKDNGHSGAGRVDAVMTFAILEARVNMRTDATTVVPMPSARIRFSKLWIDPPVGPPNDLSAI